MTVSSSVGRQFTVHQLVRQAFQISGLKGISQTPNADEYKFGRTLLESILDATEGLSHAHARAQDFHVLTLVIDQAEYTLPATILELQGTAMLIDANATETQVLVMDQVEYQILASKNITGRPHKYYQSRVGDAIKVILWPVPNIANTVRFMTQRKYSDTDDGNATFDVQNYWMTYLRFELGSQLAGSQSLDEKEMSLAVKANAALQKANAKARPKHREQFHHAHISNDRRGRR